MNMGLWSSRNDSGENPSKGIDAPAGNPMLFSNQLKQRTTMIKKLSLGTLNDIASIKEEISSGNMAIIDVAQFVTSGEFSILELKRAIEQIRGTCKQLGGMLARLGDRYLIATPHEQLRLSL